MATALSYACNRSFLDRFPLGPISLAYRATHSEHHAGVVVELAQSGMNFELNIDVSALMLVTGIANPSPAPAPPFVQDDTLTIRVRLLRRSQSFPFGVPYTVISLSGCKIQAALGSRTGTLYANDLGLNQSTDLKDPDYFSGEFTLNTAPIDALLSGLQSAPAVFEIKWTDPDGNLATVLQLPVTIWSPVFSTKAAILAMSPPAPAGSKPASVEFVNALFRTVSGMLTLENPNTGKKMALYVGDDGEFHSDCLN